MWRPRSERLNPAFALQRHTALTSGVMETFFNKARVSQDCLRTVTTLPWPARSSDLSPIEHIWDHLGWRVGPPTSLNELEARLLQIWNEMSQDIIQNLYASIPDRISLCIRARGGSTSLEPTQRKHLQNFSKPTETVFCQGPMFFGGLRHFQKEESQLKMNLAAKGPQFQKPLKVSLESRILCVQIIA
ncbi:transposable element Tcb1 transposase [Trichonephila clavipes]|nr:transposable element Tcb1 transposase [Trichonephila clavipes]